MLKIYNNEHKVLVLFNIKHETLTCNIKLKLKYEMGENKKRIQGYLEYATWNIEQNTWNVKC